MGRGFVSRILIGVATPTEPKIFANGELWRTPIHERRKHERHKMVDLFLNADLSH